MAIKLYKLVTGDEVIGMEESGPATTLRIVLHKPRILAIVQGPNGPAIALRPFYVGNPAVDDVSFTRAQVIGDAVSVQQALEDAYLQQTSGLILGGRVS